MSQESPGPGSPVEADSCHALAAAMSEATRRILDDGVCSSHVLSAIALAQFLPGVFAAIYDREGRYVWTSASFGQITGVQAKSVLGRTIGELFPSNWSYERSRLLQRVLSGGVPLATVEIFRGRRLEAVALPIDAAGPLMAVAYVGRFGLSSPGAEQGLSACPSWEVVRLESADWGPLSALTRRELEVLRWIALGLDNDAIARSIHRTKRAVEWHIQKLYAHLRCTQRAELFKAGLLAGLHEIDETHWERMLDAVRLEHAPHA